MSQMIDLGSLPKAPDIDKGGDWVVDPRVLQKIKDLLTSPIGYYAGQPGLALEEIEAVVLAISIMRMQQLLRQDTASQDEPCSK